MATMNVPGIGAVDSKWVIGGAALTLGIVGYAYYRQSQQATADVPVDETAADGYAVDQGVGYGYAGVGTDFAGDGTGSYYGPTYSYPPTTSTSVSAPPVTNLDWSGQAVEYLQEQGVDSQVASLSTSKYLLKDCLTPTQADVVRMAVGRFGIPPQSQDLRILQCPTTPTTTPPTTTVTKKQPTGLKVVSRTRTQIRIDWNPVGAVGSTPGLVGYQVYVNGKRVVTLSYSGAYTKGYLKPNTSYRFQVFAVYRMPGKSSDERGPGSAILTAKTSK